MLLYLIVLSGVEISTVSVGALPFPYQRVPGRNWKSCAGNVQETGHQTMAITLAKDQRISSDGSAAPASHERCQKLGAIPDSNSESSRPIPVSSVQSQISRGHTPCQSVALLPVVLAGKS